MFNSRIGALRLPFHGAIASCCLCRTVSPCRSSTATDSFDPTLRFCLHLTVIPNGEVHQTAKRNWILGMVTSQALESFRACLKHPRQLTLRIPSRNRSSRRVTESLLVILRVRDNVSMSKCSTKFLLAHAVQYRIFMASSANFPVFGSLPLFMPWISLARLEFSFLPLAKSSILSHCLDDYAIMGQVQRKSVFLRYISGRGSKLACWILCGISSTVLK